jgi:hypothetical protein
VNRFCMIILWAISLSLGHYFCEAGEPPEDHVMAVELAPLVPQNEPPVLVPPVLAPSEAVAINSIIKIVATIGIPLVVMPSMQRLSDDLQHKDFAGAAAPLFLGIAGAYALEHLVSRVSNSSSVVNRITAWYGHDPIAKDSMVESVYFTQGVLYNQTLAGLMWAFPPNLVTNSLRYSAAIGSLLYPASSIVKSALHLAIRYRSRQMAPH